MADMVPSARLKGAGAGCALGNARALGGAQRLAPHTAAAIYRFKSAAGATRSAPSERRLLLRVVAPHWPWGVAVTLDGGAYDYHVAPGPLQPLPLQKRSGCSGVLRV
ncbi:hypothetical protein T492DRAFT_870630 [Pavlovales sp. CCMP2436]|nr:hypothetical protein T492DRAFT_870630 [Pavlovales sp. CCMP2436]